MCSWWNNYYGGKDYSNRSNYFAPNSPEAINENRINSPEDFNDNRINSPGDFNDNRINSPEDFNDNRINSPEDFNDNRINHSIFIFCPQGINFKCL